MDAATVRVEDLGGAIAPDGWLGHRTQERFLHLAASSLAAWSREIAAGGDARGFFARRSLRSPRSDGGARTLAQELVAVDLRAVAHAASFLLSEAAEETARELLRDALGSALADDPARLDHVGLEVFGRLEWYLAALEAWQRQGAVRLRGCRVFPSVQVRRALAYDPALGDVRIARVYLESARRRVNLEIFEAAQHWLFTAARQLATYRDAPAPAAVASAGLGSLFRELGSALALPLVPVAHLALAVSRRRTLEAVDRILVDPARREAIARPYDGLSYNPGDRSLNTKFRTRRGPIIELIHYGGRAPSRLPGDGTRVGAAASSAEELDGPRLGTLAVRPAR